MLLLPLPLLLLLLPPLPLPLLLLLLPLLPLPLPLLLLLPPPLLLLLLLLPLLLLLLLPLLPACTMLRAGCSGKGAVQEERLGLVNCVLGGAILPEVNDLGETVEQQHFVPAGGWGVRKGGHIVSARRSSIC